jgi:hypothetical protein
MKKKLIVFCCFVCILLPFFGCGNQKNSASSTSAENSYVDKVSAKVSGGSGDVAVSEQAPTSLEIDEPPFDMTSYTSGLKVRKPLAIGFPFVASTSIKLRDFGYVQHEFFYSGTAHSYANTKPMTPDGKWTVAPIESALYKTRMLVYRPSDPAKFNGTVIVEWFNVTGGLDTAAEWVSMHTEMLRRGYAWVGISAQYIGVEGGKPPLYTPLGMSMPLKLIEYFRYYSLSHPGDSFSYDIFGQGAYLVRHPDPEGIAPLGELTGSVKHLIAAGESQSATRLVTFINAFGKYIDFIDGYFVHCRLGFIPDFGGASAPLSQAPQDYLTTPAVVRMRDDLGKPVMNLQAETDSFVLGAYYSTQPDSDTFRMWEVTGTAHADNYITWGGMSDKGDDISSAEITLTKRPIFVMPAATDAINSAPQHHFVANAALYALKNWLEHDILPTSAPRFEINAMGDGFRFDDYGNVLGGVRTPYVDAPVARFSGSSSYVNDGKNIYFLMGQTEMLSDDIVKALYPSHGAYVAKVTETALNAVAEGYLLEEDAELIIGAAEAGDIPSE